jgi:Iodothyronine deiodinase
MSNAAEGAYSAWPERLYVIDESGHIAYRGGMGPFHYDPKEVRTWLAARYGEVKHEEKPATKPEDKKTDDKKPAEAPAAAPEKAPTPTQTSKTGE